MEIASVFEWFAQESMNAAEQANEPRQREMLLRLALMWATAAQQCRAGEAPPMQSSPQHRVHAAPLGNPRRRASGVGSIHHSATFCRRTEELVIPESCSAHKRLPPLSLPTPLPRSRSRCRTEAASTSCLLTLHHVNCANGGVSIIGYADKRRTSD